MPRPILVVPSLMRTRFASYDADSGEVSLQEAAPAAGRAAYAGIQRLCDPGDLLASLFLRSDDSLGATAWQGREAEAVFSNLRVLAGTPTQIVPVTGSITLTALWLGIGPRIGHGIRRGRRRIPAQPR